MSEVEKLPVKETPVKEIINLNVDILDFDGQSIPQITVEKGEAVIKKDAAGNQVNVTARTVLLDSLNRQAPGDKDEFEEKMERFKLSERIASGFVELTTHEKAKLLTRLGQTHNALVVGRVEAILERRK